MNRFYKKYIVPPDTRVSLAKYDPDDTLDFKDKIPCIGDKRLSE